MKFGPKTWGIVLFGATVVLLVSAKDHRAAGWAAEWDAADEAVQLKSPGRNLMISTVWTPRDCATGSGTTCPPEACTAEGACTEPGETHRALMKPAP
ncbi:MAG: hypothetical protein ACFB6R_00950 [Alphaproteobacteria bacterium]